MKNAFIFGAGGHARVIASIIHKRYSNIFFRVLHITEQGSVGEDSFYRELNEYKTADVFIGIGLNSARKNIFNKLLSLGITPSNCIADNTFIAHDAEIGRGVVICPGSIIGSKAKLSDNVIVNTLSSIDHDCLLSAHSQVTAGVTFGGGTLVGENCFFGIKSATIPNIKVGDNSIIMAGSILYKDVPENVVAGGNPARIMKMIN